MTRSTVGLIGVGLLVTGLVLIGFGWWRAVNLPMISPVVVGPGQALVKKVVDGDTIEVEMAGVTKMVRYIGINTPETVDPHRGVQCFGPESSRANKSLVEGKAIILEKDVSEVDKYDRWLRYVYLPQPDGSRLFVNDYLVRMGYAQAMSIAPDLKYQPRLMAAESQARLSKLGLWNKCYN